MYSCGDSYVVRIYRRDEQHPGKVVGVVEFVGNAGQMGFKSLDELCRILAPENTGGGKEKRTNPAGKT
jgi:hypothetical protein